MRRTLLVLAVGAALAAFAVAGCGGGDDEGSGADTDTTTETTDTTETETTGEAGGTLIGSVGPGFTISLTTEDGEAVTSVPAGTYTIEVDDKSDAHNFHLTGGSVDESTTVEEVTKVTWTLDLVPGTYDYVCDPHSSTMNGSFEVT